MGKNDTILFSLKPVVNIALKMKQNSLGSFGFVQRARFIESQVAPGDVLCAKFSNNCCQPLSDMKSLLFTCNIYCVETTLKKRQLMMINKNIAENSIISTLSWPGTLFFLYGPTKRIIFPQRSYESHKVMITMEKWHELKHHTSVTQKTYIPK